MFNGRQVTDFFFFSGNRRKKVYSNDIQIPMQKQHNLPIELTIIVCVCASESYSKLAVGPLLVVVATWTFLKPWTTLFL